jgi:hypothetical protein
MSNASSPAERRALAARLLTEAASIGRASIALCYTDGFWMARFGDRGRRFADEDGLRHAQYLAEAIESGSSEPFVIYARWLRSVLTTRGMCTLHIHDNFVRLGMVLRNTDRPLFDAAVPHLDAGVRALAPEGLAGTLHQAAVDGHRDGGEDAFIDDPSFVLSYLSDAVAAGTGEHFLAHLRWVCAECDRRGARERLDRTLDQVEKRIPPGVTALFEEGRVTCAKALGA